MPRGRPRRAATRSNKMAADDATSSAANSTNNTDEEEPSEDDAKAVDKEVTATRRSRRARKPTNKFTGGGMTKTNSASSIVSSTRQGSKKRETASESEDESDDNGHDDNDDEKLKDGEGNDEGSGKKEGDNDNEAEGDDDSLDSADDDKPIIDLAKKVQGAKAKKEGSKSKTTRGKPATRRSSRTQSGTEDESNIKRVPPPRRGKRGAKTSEDESQASKRPRTRRIGGQTKDDSEDEDAKQATSSGNEEGTSRGDTDSKGPGNESDEGDESSSRSNDDANAPTGRKSYERHKRTKKTMSRSKMGATNQTSDRDEVQQTTRRKRTRQKRGSEGGSSNEENHESDSDVSAASSKESAGRSRRSRRSGASNTKKVPVIVESELEASPAQQNKKESDEGDSATKDKKEDPPEHLPANETTKDNESDGVGDQDQVEPVKTAGRQAMSNDDVVHEKQGSAGVVEKRSDKETVVISNDTKGKGDSFESQSSGPRSKDPKDIDIDPMGKSPKRDPVEIKAGYIVQDEEMKEALPAGGANKESTKKEESASEKVAEVDPYIAIEGLGGITTAAVEAVTVKLTEEETGNDTIELCVRETEASLKGGSSDSTVGRVPDESAAEDRAVPSTLSEKSNAAKGNKFPTEKQQAEDQAASPSKDIPTTNANLGAGGTDGQLDSAGTNNSTYTFAKNHVEQKQGPVDGSDTHIEDMSARKIPESSSETSPLELDEGIKSKTDRDITSSLATSSSGPEQDKKAATGTIVDAVATLKFGDLNGSTSTQVQSLAPGKSDGENLGDSHLQSISKVSTLGTEHGPSVVGSIVPCNPELTSHLSSDVSPSAGNIDAQKKSGIIDLAANGVANSKTLGMTAPMSPSVNAPLAVSQDGGGAREGKEVDSDEAVSSRKKETSDAQPNVMSLKEQLTEISTPERNESSNAENSSRVNSTGRSPMGVQSLETSAAQKRALHSSDNGSRSSIDENAPLSEKSRVVTSEIYVGQPLTHFTSQDKDIPDESEVAEVPLEPLPQVNLKRCNLDKIKMLLFSTGGLVHRGRGFEKMFGEYWGAMSLIVAGNQDDTRLAKLRGVVKAFLKTKKLRKLHNRLILALIDRSMQKTVPLSEVSDVLPLSMRSKIKVIYPNGTNHPEPKKSSRSALLPKKPQLEKCAIKKGHATESIPYASLFSKNTEAVPTKISETEDKALPSSRLPGALVADPFIRQIVEDEGMNVSERAVWLCVLALKEYTKSIAGRTIQSKEARQKLMIPPKPHLDRVLCKGKGALVSIADCLSKLDKKESPAKASVTTEGDKCISVEDITLVASTMKRNPMDALGGTASRLAIERCILSPPDASLAMRGAAFDEIHSFLTCSITVASSEKQNELRAKRLAAKSATTYKPMEGQPSHQDATAAKKEDFTVPKPVPNVERTTTRPIAPVVRRGGKNLGLGRGAKNLAALMARAAVPATKPPATDTLETAPTANSTTEAVLAKPKNDSPATNPASSAPAPAVVRTGGGENSEPVPAQTGAQPSLLKRGNPNQIIARGRGLGKKNLSALRQSITKPGEEGDGKNSEAPAIPVAEAITAQAPVAPSEQSSSQCQTNTAGTATQLLASAPPALFPIVQSVAKTEEAKGQPASAVTEPLKSATNAAPSKERAPPITTLSSLAKLGAAPVVSSGTQGNTRNTVSAPQSQETSNLSNVLLIASAANEKAGATLPTSCEKTEVVTSTSQGELESTTKTSDSKDTGKVKYGETMDANQGQKNESPTDRATEAKQVEPEEGQRKNERPNH